MSTNFYDEIRPLWIISDGGRFDLNYTTPQGSYVGEVHPDGTGYAVLLQTPEAKTYTWKVVALNEALSKVEHGIFLGVRDQEAIAQFVGIIDASAKDQRSINRESRGSWLVSIASKIHEAEQHVMDMNVPGYEDTLHKLGAMILCALADSRSQRESEG